MRKNKIKPTGKLAITCPAGFDDKMLDKMFDVFEKELNKYAKDKNYKIDGLIWIYPLSKKASRRR